MTMMKIMNICIVGLTIVGCTQSEDDAMLGCVSTPETQIILSTSNSNLLEEDNFQTIQTMVKETEDLKNIECLAKNIYFEARSESQAGQIAVANVTMNRTESGEFPDNVCDVVYEKKQFSWTNSNKNKSPKDKKVYREIYKLAEEVYYSRIVDITEGALFYHADHVKPYWAKGMIKIASIDGHIFYKPKDS
jgi:spore germination cell wall hydrolase CwlJ-like protein